MTAEEILGKIDSYRVPDREFEMTMRVENFAEDRLDKSAVLNAFIRDGRAERIVFLEPGPMKGRQVVMRGEDMFMIVPDTKNPVRITPSQKLMTGVSYADLVRMNFSRDYRATLETELPVQGRHPDGKRTGPINCYLLELKARKEESTYNRVTLWVEKETLVPVRADFFALSGKRTLTVYYAAPKEWNGRTVISKMFIYDRVQTAYHTVVEYLDMRPAGVPVQTNRADMTNSSVK